MRIDQKVPTFQDLGIDQLKVHSYDGATIEPAYGPPIELWASNTEDTKIKETVTVVMSYSH